MKHPTAQIHPLAYVSEYAHIGAYCVVWQFASVLENATLSTCVSVGAGSEIGKGSRIGHHSRISAQVFIPANTRIGHHSFIGPRVVMTDDKFPRAGNENYTAQSPRIGNDVSVGAGAVILPNVTIGDRARIAAGAIVTRDVPADGFVRCEPAREYEMPLEFIHREMLDVVGEN
jgi:acetyltransferase-like isoleucine patch superfamily enzyme